MNFADFYCNKENFWIFIISKSETSRKSWNLKNLLRIGKGNDMEATYIATIRTWPQVGVDSWDLELVSRVFSGKTQIEELFAWMKGFKGNIPNIVLVENEIGKGK